MPNRLFAQPAVRRLWPYHPWLLAALWLLVQVAFLLKFHGPHFANDSALYLEYAENVARHGHYVQPPLTSTVELSPELPNPDTFVGEHVGRYAVYAWFEAFWLWLGAGRWGIVLGQLALSGLAAAALYGSGRQLAGGRRLPAALATLLFITWPDIQQFNCYLLTESLFISLSVLVLPALLAVRRGGWRAWMMLALALLLVARARPNGFVLAGAAALAGLAALWASPRRRPLVWWLLGTAVAATPLALVALNYQLRSYFIVETYQRGELLFGTPVWAVHPSRPLDMPPPGTGQVLRIGYFAAHNPGFLLRLMVGKLLVYFSSIKPYYSLGHKVLSVLVLWPCYWLAGRGAARAGVWLPGRVFLAAVPLLQAAVVMLTVDDYDVRFLAPVLPFIFTLAALAVGGRLAARAAPHPLAPSPAERGASF